MSYGVAGEESQEIFNHGSRRIIKKHVIDELTNTKSNILDSLCVMGCSRCHIAFLWLCHTTRPVLCSWRSYMGYMLEICWLQFRLKLCSLKLHVNDAQPCRRRLTLDQNMVMTMTRWAIRVRNRAGTRLLITHIDLDRIKHMLPVNKFFNLGFFILVELCKRVKVQVTA